MFSVPNLESLNISIVVTSVPRVHAVMGASKDSASLNMAFVLITRRTSHPEMSARNSLAL